MGSGCAGVLERPLSQRQTSQHHSIVCKLWYFGPALLFCRLNWSHSRVINTIRSRHDLLPHLYFPAPSHPHRHTPEKKAWPSVQTLYRAFATLTVSVLLRIKNKHTEFVKTPFSPHKMISYSSSQQASADDC